LNIHDTQDVANVDDIIEYTLNTRLVMEASGTREESSYAPDALCANMSGLSPLGGYSQAYIHHVLAATQGNSASKGGNVNINETSVILDTLKSVIPHTLSAR
jgi:hypothetical protein